MQVGHWASYLQKDLQFEAHGSKSSVNLLILKYNHAISLDLCAPTRIYRGQAYVFHISKVSALFALLTCIDVSMELILEGKETQQRPGESSYALPAQTAMGQK